MTLNPFCYVLLINNEFSRVFVTIHFNLNGFKLMRRSAVQKGANNAQLTDGTAQAA